MRILTASEWVDKVAPRSHYDPGWAGTAAMIAPEGAPGYELPWTQIQAGITLVIPPVLQLIDFQEISLAELHAKFWTDRSRDSSVRIRGNSPETCVIEHKQLREALKALSKFVN